MTPSRWNLRILGTFDLADGDVVVDSFGERRDEELLAYLAVTGPTLASRDTIAGSMWPDVEPATARKHLSFYLFQLKKRMQERGLEQVIEEVRKRLRLHPSIHVDAACFARRLAEGARASAPSERIWHLDEAIRMYGAGLLPGIAFPWLKKHQQQFETLYQDAARELARLTQGDSPMRNAILHLPAAAWQASASDLAKASSIEAPTDEPPDPAEPVDVDAVIELVARIVADLGSGAVGAAMETLAQHEQEVLAAADQLAQAGRREDALGMLTPVWRYWHRNKQPEVGFQAIGRILAMPGDLPDDLRARAQSAAGNLAASAGRHAQARDLLEHALAHWQAQDERMEMLRAHANLGRVLHLMGEYERAREHYEPSLALAGGLRNDPARLEILRSTALNEIRLGDARRAERHLRERLALLKADDEADPLAEADTLAHLASVHLLAGEQARAVEIARKARAGFAAAESRAGEIQCLMLLGRAAFQRGDLDRSRTILQEAVAMARDADDPRQIGLALSYLGVVLEVSGDERAGLTQWEAVNILSSMGRMGEVAAIQQELAEFRAWAEGAVPPRLA